VLCVCADMLTCVCSRTPTRAAPGVALARAEYAHIVLPNATPVRTTSAFAPARLEYVGLAMEPVTGPRSNYSTPHVPAQQQHAGYEPLQLTAPPKPERT
jgi:hypothetical protein